MGGSITSYMALPNGDSVSNTDLASGNFFIAKIGISDCSCPTPGAQFTQTTKGDTAYFYGSGINRLDSIHWEFGDGSTGSGDTLRHIYTSIGTYTVTAIAYNGCGVDSIRRQITLTNCIMPAVQFTDTLHSGTVYFYATTTNSDSIHWLFGANTVSTSDTFSHVYTQNGTYTVTAVVYNSCGTDSLTKQVIVTNVGIQTISTDKTQVYPNPASNEVNVEVSGAAKIGLVTANGTSLWDQPVQVNQAGTYVFDMGKYSGGLYYYIVEYSNGKVDVLSVVKK
jgi:PKD repeat protein